MSSVAEILEKKRAAEQLIEAIREELKATGGKFICEALAHLFAEYPEVKGFRWTQYTPYFNDGDACVFSSGHEYGEILVLEDPEDPEGELVTMEDGVGYESERWDHFAPIDDKFREAFPELTDDDMEALFGDHARVTVFPDRVEVEEYSHD